MESDDTTKAECDPIDVDMPTTSSGSPDRTVIKDALPEKKVQNVLIIALTMHCR